GLGGRYRPVTIQPQAASTSPVVLVEIFNGAPGGTVDNSLSNLSANRYYRIQLQSGILNQPTVQLSFNTDGTIDEQVNVPGNLRVARSTGNNGPWTNAGGAGAYSPAAPRGYTISAPTPVDATSYFALASTNAVDNPLTGIAPLPVQLVRFTATKQGSAVLVNWTTASEKNSAYFAVERADQGTRFAEISRVAAQNNSTTNHNYALVDAAPLPGLNYYRLRQVDLDGTVAYSPVATVRFAGSALQPMLTIYPNPVEATQNLHLVATGLATEEAIVRMHDSLGRLVTSQQVINGTNEVLLQPSSVLTAGLYFITWQAASGGTLTTKVVVK
ncbi:MAG: T9SS type A sorting domain-containing protein, partial [Hymenobacter sp.]